MRNFTKCQKGQEIVERHDHSRSEGTKHKEGDTNATNADIYFPHTPIIRNVDEKNLLKLHKFAETILKFLSPLKH